VSVLVAATICLTSPVTAGGQAHQGGHSAAGELGASGVLLVTRVDPAAQGRSLTEGYLTQPMLSASARWTPLQLTVRGMLNFETLTLDRGELGPGVYGEGYIDRRHPHTVLHELMGSATGRVGAAGWSVAAGKGFVPFGSDDPMSRPFVKYPVNHHLAQILERAAAIVAVRVGGVAVEGAWFNGDEPETPRDWPNRERFGDSWSVRGTAWIGIAELSSSAARVRSPEDAGGHGLDHHRRHVGVRLHAPAAGARGAYALLEWARTDELSGAHLAFRFASILVEASAPIGPVRGALRFERTTRPDEQRLADPFRSPRPLLDFSIEGRSRWDVVTMSLVADARAEARAALEPFAEVQVASVRATIRPTVFEPRDFYGAERMWALSAGVRLRLGDPHRRVGRYGVAAR
jgi:hypothetical protein